MSLIVSTAGYHRQHCTTDFSASIFVHLLAWPSVHRRLAERLDYDIYPWWGGCAGPYPLLVGPSLGANVVIPKRTAY